jgi:hypothetical protein
MDRERLTRLLEEPGKVAREDLADLQALTERFPWFSGAHLLRAVGAHSGGDVLADETLRSSAVHIPSRAVLFDLTDVSMAEAAAELRQPSLTVVPKAAPAQEPEAVSAPPNETHRDVVPQAVEVTEPVVDEAPAPVDLHEEPAIEEASAEAPPIAVEDPVDPVKEELDRQILEAAKASAYDLTWRTELQSAPIKQQRPEPPPAEPVAAPAKEPVPAPAPIRGRMKFTDWLEATAVPTTTVHAPAPLPGPEQPAPLEQPAPTARDAAATFDPNILIDRFIQKENPAPVRKAEFFNPQQAAKKSLDDSAGLVSETLARIYEKQGNLQKAIEAYRKLALKYPEKSAYFVALSKELEGRSND